MTDRPIDRFATLDAPASWQAVDFISDLHLHAGDTTTQAAWLAYLEGAAGTDALQHRGLRRGRESAACSGKAPGNSPMLNFHTASR